MAPVLASREGEIGVQIVSNRGAQKGPSMGATAAANLG